MINILKDKRRKELTKKDIYDFLRQYCREEIELSNRKSTSEDSFEKPAWSEFQAYQLGIQKAFNKLLDLIPDQEPSN